MEVLKDILTENKINCKKGNSFWFKSDQEDVAGLSRDSSIVINCHVTKSTIFWSARGLHELEMCNLVCTKKKLREYQRKKP